MTYSRRRFLGAGAAGVALAVAGCSASGADGDDPAGTPGLAGVEVTNYDDRAHSVDVLVRRDDEIVHWSSHDLDAMEDNAYDDASIETAWATDSGRFVVSARMDGREGWEQVDLSNYGDVECYRIKVAIDGDGGLEFWRSETPGACATETASE